MNQMTITVTEGSALLSRVREAVATRIIGQEAAIDDVLVTFLARGHALIEGVPGTAKTLLVRTMASAMAIRFTRIQFTPDLMPADVTGVALYRDPARGFEFQPDPVFTDLLLADEINRAPAKTQAALLESTAGFVVHRSRDTESRRARGNISSARSAARPLSDEDRRWISAGRRRAANAGTS